MIDGPPSGNIYVIGGWDGGDRFNDVWVSRDGGADRTRAGYSAGTQRVLRGIRDVLSA